MRVAVGAGGEPTEDCSAEGGFWTVLRVDFLQSLRGRLVETH